MSNLNRFTGPKITLDVGDLTAEQEQAIREEGLDVAIEGRALSSDEKVGEKGTEKLKTDG